MVTAAEALQRLQEGNRRFVAGQSCVANHSDSALRAGLVERQYPIAAVVGCSDSRVPVELVFDQGFGDLFVIRIAGNIVAPSQIVSVEFAAQCYGVRLVIVLGHTRCGAVEETVDHLTRAHSDGPLDLRSIVSRIQPAVEGLLETELRNDREALLRQAVRSNVRLSANTLRTGSGLIERLIRDDGLLVIGAEYALETGVVDFFDGLPEAHRVP